MVKKLKMCCERAKKRKNENKMEKTNKWKRLKERKKHVWKNESQKKVRKYEKRFKKHVFHFVFLFSKRVKQGTACKTQSVQKSNEHKNK